MFINLELTSEKVLCNLRLSVRELGWSVRIESCLLNQNIEYVWQLVQCSEYELLRMKNFGRKSLNEIKATLWSFGLGLNFFLGTDDIAKITNFQRVPDQEYLREWLRKTVVELNRTPLEILNKRQELILRKRIWATGKKVTHQQLAQLFEVSTQMTRVIEKKVLNKLRSHFLDELVDINYYLLGEFAERCNSIEFTDTCFDLINLSGQDQRITDSLLGLAIEGLTVDWNRSRLMLNEYTQQDIADLKLYFSQSKGILPHQFITQQTIREQRSNEAIVRHQNTLHHLKWLAP